MTELLAFTLTLATNPFSWFWFVAGMIAGAVTLYAVIAWLIIREL